MHPLLRVFCLVLASLIAGCAPAKVLAPIVQPAAFFRESSPTIIAIGEYGATDDVLTFSSNGTYRRFMKPDGIDTLASELGVFGPRNTRAPTEREKLTDGIIVTATFSADGTMLAVAELIKFAPGVVRTQVNVWQLQPPKRVHTFVLNDFEGVYQFCFSPDSKLLAASTVRDGRMESGRSDIYISSPDVILWSIASGERTDLNDQTEESMGFARGKEINMIFFSHDGRKLFLAGDRHRIEEATRIDRSLHIFDLHSKEWKAIKAPPRLTIPARPDSDWQLLELHTPQADALLIDVRWFKQLPYRTSICDYDFTTSGRWIAVSLSKGGTLLYDGRTANAVVHLARSEGDSGFSQPTEFFSTPYWPVRFSRDGKRLYTTDTDERLVIWSLAK